MEALHPSLRALANYKQFIIYKVTPSCSREGKFDKIPVNYLTDAKINWQDSKNWLSVEDALEILKNLGENYGLGFVFTKNDPFFFLDMDCAYDPEKNEWSPIAIELYQLFSQAAFEVSYSRKGAHIFGTYTSEIKHKCKNSEFNIELYTENHFAALTGDTPQGDISCDYTVALSQCIEKYFRINKDSVDDNANSVEGNEWRTSPVPEWSGYTNDSELIQRAKESKSGGAVFRGKASFDDLWEANSDKLGVTYPSENDRPYDYSGADAALAQHLAWWTGNHHQRIYELMLESNLKRDKWGREDYLPRTIRAACKQQNSWCAFIVQEKTEFQSQNNFNSDNEWQIVNIANIRAEPPSLPKFIIDLLLPQNELSLCAGHGATGKSQLALQAAICIAMGLQFFGNKTIRSRVLFISAEDAAEIVRFRIDIICREMNIDPQLVAENLMILDATVDPSLYEELSGNKAKITAKYSKLIDYIESFRAEVVIIDNASDTFDANENVRSYVRGFLRALKQLKVTVLLLAHVNKKTADGQNGTQNYSGNSQWHNSSRSRWFLENKDASITLSHEKSNYGKLAAPIPLVRSSNGVLIHLSVNPFEVHAQDKAAILGLLKLIDKLYNQGDFISPAKNVLKRTFNTLKDDRDFPSSIVHATKMQNLLENAENECLLIRDQYKNADSKNRIRWKVTTKGAETLAAIILPTDSNG